MAILTNQDFQTRDIYIYYDFEEAFLRYDHNSKKFFLKLLNSGDEYERPRDNRLVCDIWCFGDEITKKQYYSETPPKK